MKNTFENRNKLTLTKTGSYRLNNTYKYYIYRTNDDSCKHCSRSYFALTSLISNGKGLFCDSKCATQYIMIKSRGLFAERGYKMHNGFYTYDNALYNNNYDKVIITCPIHGDFLQRPNDHLQGRGCPKCAYANNCKYNSNNIPIYDTYQPQLEPYGVKCRRSPNDTNILEVRCHYCKKWHQPKRNAVRRKINACKSLNKGEHNLYCSDVCKQSCPTFHMIKHTNGYDKQVTSREMQSHWRSLILKKDGYQCVKCKATMDEKQLHAHHIDTYKTTYDSMVIDNGITLCIDCHQEVHRQTGCKVSDIIKKCKDNESD